MTEAPTWRVNDKSFIGHSLLEEGAETQYTPPVGADGRTVGVAENLSPLNDAAQAIVNEQAQPHPDKQAAKAPKPAKAPKAPKAGKDADEPEVAPVDDEKDDDVA